MYKIIFDKKSLHDLNKLDKEVRDRIWDKVQECNQDPFHFFEKLTETEGFKLRIGDWRVVADIDRANQTISVLKIGHRKNVYDR